MKINQLKAGVILSYISIGINAVIQLAYTPVMLRLLGQSEYGLYTLVASIVSYLGLLTFGTGGAYLRFYFREKSQGDEQSIARLNGTFFTIFLILGTAAMAAGLVLSANAGLVFGAKLSAQELEKAEFLLLVMAVNMAVSIITSIFNSYITACEKYFFQRLISIAGTILNPFLTLPLLLMGVGSTALVLVSLAVTVITAAANIYFCICRLGLKFHFRGLQIGLVKSVFVFSSFVFLNQIIDQVNWNIDSFLLGRFWGTLEVAVYGLASRINSLYLTFSTSISSVFAPRINRIVAEEKEPDGQLLKLMLRVGRIQALVLLLLLLGMILLGRPFLLLMGGDESYLRAYPALLLLVVPATVPLVQNLGLEIQRAKNKHHFRSIIYFAMALINVLMSIPLSASYGSTGAAVGTAASLIIGNGVVMNWYYHKHLGLNMKAFWAGMAGLLKGLVLPAVYCVICALFVNTFDTLYFCLTGAGLVTVYSLSMWKLSMNDDEKALVTKVLRKIGLVKKVGNKD